MSKLSAFTGIDAANNAAKAGNQTTSLANSLANSYFSNAPSTTGALKTNAGISSDGTYNPDYNPAQGLYDGLFSPSAISNTANAIYNPDQLYASMGNYKSATAPNYTGAVTAADADAAGRGFNGEDSALDSTTSAIRRQEASDQSNFNTNLEAGLNTAKNSFEAGQTTAGENLLGTGLQDEESSLGQLNATNQNNIGTALGSFGGLQGMYANQAANSGFSSLLGSLTSLFGLGKGATTGGAQSGTGANSAALSAAGPAYFAAA